MAVDQRPASHVVHVPAPDTALYCPAKQSSHPTPLEWRPAGHVLHVRLAPSSEYVPGAHAPQYVRPSATWKVVRAGHGVHGPALPNDAINVPAAHLLHRT